MSLAVEQRDLVVDGRRYELEIRSTHVMPPHAPRLLTVSYLPTPQAVDLLRSSLLSYQRFTPQPHELWVVDNNSPPEHLAWLLETPGVNVALNHTEPIPPQKRGAAGLAARLRRRYGQVHWGSYANAIGLELGVRLIDPQTTELWAFHMDTLVCNPQWLPFLQSKLDATTRIAGVRLDRRRVAEGLVHVLGYLLDFQLFRRMGLDFLPALPGLDVGDRVSVELRKAGYALYATPNTLTDPEAQRLIPAASPLRAWEGELALDDDGNVILVHLNRGIKRSRISGLPGNTVEDWKALAETVLTLPAT